MSPFQLALINISRRRFSSLSLVLSMSVVLAAASMLYHFHLLSESRFANLALGGDAVIGAKAGEIEILLSSLNGEGDYPDFLPSRLYESLKNRQPIQFEDGHRAEPSYLEAIIPILYFGKTLGRYRVLGTDLNFYERNRIEDSIHIKEGRVPTAGTEELVIGSEVALREKLGIGSEVPVNSWPAQEKETLRSITAIDTSGSHQFKVVGILEKQNSVWDWTTFSSIETAQSHLPSENLRRSIWGRNVLHFFIVYLAKGTFHELDALVNRRTVAQAISIPVARQRLHEIAGDGEVMGLWIVSVILLLGGLTICSVLVTRYDGMSIQFAILRALGFVRSELLQWILLEGLVLAIFSIVLGTAVESLCFSIVRSSLYSSFPEFSLDQFSVFQLWPVWLAMSLGILFGSFLPLIRIYRQDIQNSLRGL